MLEKNIQSEAACHASKQGVRLFRNHVGKGFMGQAVCRAKSLGELANGVKRLVSRAMANPKLGLQESHYVVIRWPRETTFGLCVGSSDLIGLTTIDENAIFTAFETKTKIGKPTDEQKNFIEFVRSAGGIAGIVRSNDDIDNLLKEFKSK